MGGERAAEVRGVGERDELAGAEQAPGGVLPPGQGLDADQVAGVDGDLRLVVQHELVGVQGAPEVGEQGQPGHRVAVLLGGVVRVGQPQVRRDVHGSLGLAHQVGHIIAGGGRRDADADVQFQADAVEHERPGHLGQHPFGCHGGLVEVAVGQQDAELVAAEPGHQVAAPQRRHQPLPDADQQLVAVAVPERIVDPPEVVDVQQQHDRPPAAPGRRPQRPPAGVGERRSVGQPGQPVPHRLGLDRPPVGVVDQREQADQQDAGRARDRCQGLAQVHLASQLLPLDLAGLLPPGRQRGQLPGLLVQHRLDHRAEHGCGLRHVTGARDPDHGALTGQVMLLGADQGVHGALVRTAEAGAQRAQQRQQRGIRRALPDPGGGIQHIVDQLPVVPLGQGARLVDAGGERRGRRRVPDDRPLAQRADRGQHRERQQHGSQAGGRQAAGGPGGEPAGPCRGSRQPAAGWGCHAW